MAETRITRMFATLERAAFMPFFTIGDPDVETTEAIVREAEARGADMVELGVPFSDPIADGPTIQASYFRALEKGFRLDSVFELARRLRSNGVEMPMVCMVSETLVYKRGISEFFKTAREAGFDGLIVPDLPAGYEGDACTTAKENGLDLVFLCAPTTTPERRVIIAEHSTGFIYYISVTGITGARDRLPADLENNVKDLRARSEKPVCVGFGISKPEQAASVGKIANGVIVGSALVKQAAQLAEQGVLGERLVKQVGDRIQALAEATHAGV